MHDPPEPSPTSDPAPRRTGSAPPTGTTTPPGLPPGGSARAGGADADRADASARRRARRRRRSRTAAILVAPLVIAVLGGMLVLRSSWFIAGRVEAALSEQFGGPVSVDHARYLGGGRFQLEGVTLRAPGVAGEPGRIAHVEAAEIRMDEAALARLEPVPIGVAVERMHLRLAEDAERPGRFAFESLRPRWSSDSEAAAPEISIEELEVEVGDYAGARFRPRASRAFFAEMQRPAGARGDAGWHCVTLQELDSSGRVHAKERIGVNGELNARSLAHRLEVENLLLEPETIALAPAAVQGLLEEMELAGAVRDVVFGWSENGFTAAFDAERVSFRLPVEAGVEWSRYRAGAIEAVGERPRLQVESGSFRFGAGRLELTDLVGRVESGADEHDVVGVPYEISFRVLELDPSGIADAGPREWAETALAAAPFELHFATRGLRVGDVDADGAAQAIEVPLPVASVLESFLFDRFTLDTELEVRRAAPAAGPEGELVAGPLTTDGRATITDADGRYGPFPYRLDDVTAELTFDRDEVRVRHVRGTGSAGAPVTIAGTVRELGPYPEVALTLEAEGVPIDERLREAFTGELGSVIDRLRDRRTTDRLVATGLLSPEDGTLQGTVDLRLRIDRTPGPGLNTTTSGEIDLSGVDVVLDRFPYPMRITEGTVRLERRSVEAIGPDGLRVRTAGGGEGRLTGVVRWTRGAEEPLEPRLVLAVEDDRVSRSLLAAIPPSDAERAEAPEAWDGWPGSVLARGGQWLERLRLGGRLDYEARLEPGSGGELEYEIAVELAQARADAAAAIREATGREPGAPLRGDWRLRDVDGRVVVTPRGLHLEAVAGTTDEGRLEVGGTISLGQEARTVDLDMTADRLSIADHLADVVPRDRRADLEPILAAHRPRGTVDVRLMVHSDGYGDATVDGTIVPRRLELDLDGTPMRFEHAGGDIGLAFGTDDRVALELRGLAFGFEDPADPSGDRDRARDRRRAASVDGRVRWGADGPPRIELAATWTMARIRSPLMRQILRWVDADEQLEQLDRLHAAADLDLAVTYRGGPPGAKDAERAPESSRGGVARSRAMGGQPAPPTDQSDATPPSRPGRDWRIRILPHSVAVRVQDVPIAVRLDPTAEVLIEPGAIHLRDVSGGNDGVRATVSGTVLTRDGIDAALTMDIEGPILGRQVAALLPAPVRTVLERLELRERKPTRVRDVRLRLRRPVGDPGADPPAPELEFDGVVELAEASLRAGVALGAVSGPFHVRLASGPDRPLDLVIDARPSTLRLAGQTLTDLEATVRMAPDGRTVRLERLRGRAGDGRVVADAAFSTEPDGPFSLAVDLAAVPLADFELAGGPDASADEDRAPRPSHGRTLAGAPAAVAPPEKRALSGEVHGSLRLAGRRGDPGALVGRGTVRIREADLFAIPPVLGVLQALQLTVPAERYDFATADLFVAGRRVHFDELYLESSFADQNAHTLVARGTLDLDTMAIEGRVRSRSGLFLPVREIMGAMGDAMAAIELGGTVLEPEVSVALLRGDRPEREAVQARPVRRRGAAEASPRPAETTVNAAGAPGSRPTGN